MYRLILTDTSNTRLPQIVVDCRSFDSAGDGHVIMGATNIRPNSGQTPERELSAARLCEDWKDGTLYLSNDWAVTGL